MDNKAAEKLATLLSHLHLIPCFNDANLFTEEVYSMVGFQIHTWLNSKGRLVFSFDMDNKTGWEGIQNDYFSEYGYQIPYKGRSDANDRSTYPTTGSDNLADIAPSTITRLLWLSESNNEQEDFIPLFIMQITDAAESWENQCLKMSESAATVKKVAEQIYEDVL